jgi:aerobic carbon-monoxide dehydrogenase small subunit
MQFRLNGRDVDVDAHPMRRLLDVLREECELTGTKEGCGEGECGACTVVIDGQAIVSCLVPFAQVDGRDVQTIEGVEAQVLQRAFMDHVGAQCGICTPGMIMAAMSLGPDPSRKQMQDALAGNLCRCTGYEAIYRAIRAAKRATRPARVSVAPQGEST